MIANVAPAKFPLVASTPAGAGAGDAWRWSSVGARLRCMRNFWDRNRLFRVGTMRKSTQSRVDPGQHRYPPGSDCDNGQWPGSTSEPLTDIPASAAGIVYRETQRNSGCSSYVVMAKLWRVAEGCATSQRRSVARAASPSRRPSSVQANGSRQGSCHLTHCESPGGCQI